MKMIIIGIVVLALCVAGVSTYLIKSFQTPEAKQELQREMMEPQKFVLVAVRNIDVGETIKLEDLTWQVWTDEGINPNYTVRDEFEEIDPAEKADLYVGSRVRRPIILGEPLLPDKVFKRDDPGYMAGNLTPGMRAITLGVQQTTGVGGFIMPGDYVDVMLTHNLFTQIREAGAQRSTIKPLDTLKSMTETIMRRKRVISVGQKVTNFEGVATTVPNITLEVTAKEGEVLTVAQSMGKLSFVLRSLSSLDPNAKVDEEEEGLSFTKDIDVSPYLSEQKSVRQAKIDDMEAAAAAAAMPPDDAGSAEEVVIEEEPSGPTIRVYRGQSNEVEEVTFGAAAGTGAAPDASLIEDAAAGVVDGFTENRLAR